MVAGTIIFLRGHLCADHHTRLQVVAPLISVGTKVDVNLDAFVEVATEMPTQWWPYVVIVTVVGAIGSVIRLEVLHYRSVQVGKLVPQTTVGLIVAAKDAEILRLHQELERWVGAFHIKDAAYVTLAESIEENTEAMNALLTLRAEPRARITEVPEAVNGRRREPR